MRSRLIRYGRIALSVALLLALLSRVDLSALAAMLGRAAPALVLAALALHVGGYILRAYKWQVLLVSRGMQVPYRTLLGYYFVGNFFSNFLPTAVGGDVVRAVDIARRTGRPVDSATSIFVERLTGFVALTAIGAVFTALNLSTLGDTPLLPALALLALAEAAAVVLLLSLGTLAHSRLLRAVPNLGGWRRIASKLADALAAYRHSRGALLWSMALSLIFQVSWIYTAYLAALAIGLSLPFWSFLVFVPAIDVLTLVPISLNGLGLREGGFVFFYVTFLKITPEEAASLALLVFLLRLVVSTVGGLVYLLRGSGSTPAGAGGRARQSPA